MAVEQIDSFLSDEARADFVLIKSASADLKATGAAVVEINNKIQASEKQRSTTTKELKDNIRGLDEQTKLLLKLGLEYQYQISDIAKEEAVLKKQIDDAKKANKEYADSSKTKAKADAEAKKELDAYLKSVKDGQKELEKLAIQQEKLAKQAEKTAQNAAAKENARLEAEEARKLTLALKDLDAERKKAEKDIQAEQKAILYLSNGYNALDAQHKKLIQSAQHLGATLGIDSKEFKEVAAQANTLDAKLKSIDGSLGNHRRNVGNYASAWNGLGFSVTQLIRELPSLQNGFATFISAISNNLPMAIDEYKKVVAINKELASQGKPVTAAFKQIAGAIFNWQTALVVAITLVGANWKKITEQFGSASTAQAILTDKTKILTSIFKEAATTYSKAASEIDILKTRFFDAAATAKTKAEVISVLNEKYRDTIGRIKGINEAEDFFINRSDAFVKALMLRAQIEGAYQTIAENTTKLLQQQAAGEASFTQKTINGFQAISDAGFFNYEQQRKRQEELNKKAADRNTADIENSVDKSNNIAKKFIIDTQKQLSDLEKAFNLGEGRKKLEDEADAESKRRLTKAADEAKKRLKLIEDFQQEVKKLGKKFREGSSDDFDLPSSLLEMSKGKKFGYQFELTIAAKFKEDQVAKEAMRLETLLNDELSGIYERQARDGYKTQEDYQNAITEVTRKYALQRAQIQIDSTKSLLELLPRQSEAWEEYYAKLSKLQADFYKIQADDPQDKKRNKSKRGRLQESLQDWQKDLQNFLQDISGIIGSVQNLQSELVGIVDDIYQRKIEKLDQERDKIKENSDAEIASINAQALTAEEKEKRIQIALAKTDAQEKAIEARQREQKIKQAKFNKAANIADIIGKTALAIINAVASNPYPLNVALAIAAGALGTAQLARAAAAHIPSYAEGTLDHPGGKARVGEAGRELVIDPDGKMKFVEKETIIDLPKHSKVFNDEQLKAMNMQFLTPQLLKTMNNDYNFERLENVFTNEIGRLNKTLMRKNWNPNIIFNGSDSYNQKHVKNL